MPPPEGEAELPKPKATQEKTSDESNFRYEGRLRLLSPDSILEASAAGGSSCRQSSCASAATFFTDFNSGLPAGTEIFNNAIISTNGGDTNSGCLMLTTNVNSQNGSFIIDTDLEQRHAGGRLPSLI